MTINHEIYYVLLFIATIASFICIKKDRRLLAFSLLLLFSLIEELCFEYLRLKTGHQYFVIYHFYAPVYYSLFACYYCLNVESKFLKKSLALSIPLFWIATAILSLSHHNYNNFPGIQLNLIGILIIMASLIVMFNIDVRDKYPIYQRPVFWISLSTLIFYSGLFLLNGVYGYLLKNNEDLAKRLNAIVNNNLNYLYYLLIIIGMVCSKPVKKYSLPSF
jgi:hypothetical protein